MVIQDSKDLWVSATQTKLKECVILCVGQETIGVWMTQRRKERKKDSEWLNFPTGNKKP